MINDVENTTRQIMGNVPAWAAWAFYSTVAMACAWAVWQFVRRFRQHRHGQPIREEQPHGRVRRPLGVRAASIIARLTFHRKLLSDPYAGIAHLMVFYGFLILLAGTTMVFLEHDTPLHFFHGRFYMVASLVVDLGGLAFVIGLVMFICRRTGRASGRILRRIDLAVLAWLLLAIGTTGFLLEGARIAVDRPDFEKWSAVGYAIATCFNAMGVSGDDALRLHRCVWIVHAILCIGFFALLPWGIFSHMVYAPVSMALRTGRNRAALRTNPLDGDGMPANEPGAAAWNRMPWLDLLQADACTTCGRCNDVCPANAAEKPLRPRDVVLGLRRAMDEAEPGSEPSTSSLSSYIADEAIWSCTTCGACNEACPVGIEVYNKIVLARQGRVEAGFVPPAAVARMDSVAESSNPFEMPNDRRMDWSTGLSVPIAEEDEQIDLLYWIGCSGSFDPDGRSVSRAMIKILNHLGLSYRVLGKRERCNGDPVRRMGEEGLFAEQAMANIELFKRHGVTRILTHCPHCFNTFKNEYPELREFDLEVVHHSQFLSRMIAQNKLAVPEGSEKTVTFHDPCYLGRGNDEVDAPRQVLHSLPQLTHVEMPRHGRESFCCGAGGGSAWLDVKGTDRIENQRASEAAATGAQTVVTGCPFCKGMLKAGCQSLEGTDLTVQDLAELIVESERL